MRVNREEEKSREIAGKEQKREGHIGEPLSEKFSIKGPGRSIRW